MKTSILPQSILFGFFTFLVCLIFGAAGIAEKAAGHIAHAASITTGRPDEFSNNLLDDDPVRKAWLAQADSVTAQIARLLRPAPSCPPPTTASGMQCVLMGDATLTAALVLPSKTVLNCQNHKLLPQPLSIPKDIFKKPDPEVAIFLNGVSSVEIENCDIEGFDFGIFAINSKVGSTIRANPRLLANLRNRIHDNTISVRYTPISLLTVDNTEISHNTLTFNAIGGRGIVVERDSDLNIINGKNTITAQFNAKLIGPFSVPGPSLPSNPVVTTGAAVFVGQIGGNEPTLLSAVINGQVFQFTTTEDTSTEPGTNFTEGNRVEDNIITFPKSPAKIGPKRTDLTDGISLPVAQGTHISGNTITHAANSVRVGIQTGPQPTGTPRKFPGTCTLDQSRRCLGDADCNIAGFGKLGTCTGTHTKGVFWLSNDNTIESNTITGPFLSGIVLAGKDTKVISNEIAGPLMPPPPAPSTTCAMKPTPTPAPLGAITLVGPHALETATITRNIVKDASIALSLQSMFSCLVPSCISNHTSCPDTTNCLGAQISLNDFMGYNIAVQTDDGYDLTSVLTVNGQGNFWGLIGNCLDPNKVQKPNGTANPAVTDCAAFSGPVARAAIGAFPPLSPCQ